MNGKYDIMKLNQGKLFLIGERYKSSDAMDRAKIVVSEHTWGGNQCPLLFEKNTFVGLLYGAKIVRKSSTLHHRLDRIVDFF